MVSLIATLDLEEVYLLNIASDLESAGAERSRSYPVEIGEAPAFKYFNFYRRLTVQSLLKHLPFSLLLAIFAIFLSSACSDPVLSGGDSGFDDVETSNDYTDDAQNDGGPPQGADVESTEPDVDYLDPDEYTWDDCDCEHPDDLCIFSQCGRTTINCAPDDVECPEGYRCWPEFSGYSRCMCDTESANCYPRCESNADCPHGSCSVHDEQVCRPGNYGCQDSMYCPEGFYCEATSESDSAGSSCERAGDLEIGEPCTDGTECYTGTCHDGFCSESCLSDDDCEAGTHCTGFSNRESNGCIESECNTTCPSNTICDEDTCHPAKCKTSGDCESGDCIANSTHLLNRASKCVENDDPELDRVCKPEEFKHSHRCYLPILCWTEDHCEHPYTCFTHYCSRRIDDN